MEIWKNLDLQDLDGEIWKNIEGYDKDYQVSNYSRIKSFKYDKINGKILQLMINDHGYLYISLCKYGKVKVKEIHKLIYENFNNYKLKKNECVHHKYENKMDNLPENLEKMNKHKHRSLHSKGKNNPMFNIHLYGNKNGMFRKHHTEETRKKQSEKRKGKYIGENNPRSKLTEKDVIEIWKDLNEGILTQREIGEKFKVHESTISAIKNRKSWKHING